MKIFISWSGELSQKVAEKLKEWLPCVIQSVDVFYSSEDIEKGESWNNKIKSELNECNFGIVCLTKQNVSAPWLHYEAGALGKTLDSRVATLMVNIKPSDIKGPLTTFQSTKFEKKDFYKLIQAINNNNDSKISEDVLNRTFNTIWDSLNKEIKEIVDACDLPIENSEKNKGNNNILEEILQNLREQRTLLSQPERLLPREYIKEISQHINLDERNMTFFLDELYEGLYRNLDFLYMVLKNDEVIYEHTKQFVHGLFRVMSNSTRRYGNIGIIRNWQKRFSNMEDKFESIFRLKIKRNNKENEMIIEDDNNLFEELKSVF